MAKERVKELSDRCVACVVEEGENPWNEERTYILINTATYNLFALRESTLIRLAKMIPKKKRSKKK